jgi:hypothetical protein
MSSGAQAQIAASQASTEAQAEAARNALNFSKEIFAESKANRRPYMDAGAGATSQLLSLLGINQFSPGTPGGGGGGTYGGGTGGGASLSSIARGGTTGGTTGGSTGGGTSGTSTGGTPTSGDTSKSGYPPYDPAFRKPTVDPNGAYFEPQFPYFDHTKEPMPGGGTKGLLSVTSGGQPTDPSTKAIPMVDGNGVEQWVPSSLVPFYQQRGLSVRG